MAKLQGLGGLFGGVFGKSTELLGLSIPSFGALFSGDGNTKELPICCLRPTCSRPIILRQRSPQASECPCRGRPMP